MKRVVFTRHSDGSCRVEFRKLTQEQALALCNALNADLRASLRLAVADDSSFQRHADADQALFEALSPPGD